jgi:TDG/mug DNA glycosylase family protein
MSTQLLPDILSKDLKIVFCGLNPGLTSAEGGHHFMNRSNRFWKVLHLSGLTPDQIAPENDRTILDYGYGLTTAVARPTISAVELSKSEFGSASLSLEKKILHYHPQYIAFLGKAAYAEISGIKNLQWGPQDSLFAGSKVWILPNPSGLNRNFDLQELIKTYGALRKNI